MQVMQMEAAQGRAPHGARGLKLNPFDGFAAGLSRAPHGARGLKPRIRLRCGRNYRRAPHGARGLKLQGCGCPAGCGGRAPHGARGLKHPPSPEHQRAHCRAPHGARGLKHQQHGRTGQKLPSRPARGAWIETTCRRRDSPSSIVAPRTGRVD